MDIGIEIGVACIQEVPGCPSKERTQHQAYPRTHLIGSFTLAHESRNNEEQSQDGCCQNTDDADTLPLLNGNRLGREFRGFGCIDVVGIYQNIRHVEGRQSQPHTRDSGKLVGEIRCVLDGQDRTGIEYGRAFFDSEGGELGQHILKR